MKQRCLPEIQRQYYCITSFTHGHGTPTVGPIYVTLSPYRAFIGAILAQIALTVLVIIGYLRDCIASNPGTRVWRPSNPGNPGFINPVRVCQP